MRGKSNGGDWAKLSKRIADTGRRYRTTIALICCAALVVISHAVPTISRNIDQTIHKVFGIETHTVSLQKRIEEADGVLAERNILTAHLAAEADSLAAAGRLDREVVNRLAEASLGSELDHAIIDALAEQVSQSALDEAVIADLSRRVVDLEKDRSKVIKELNWHKLLIGQLRTQRAAFLLTSSKILATIARRLRQTSLSNISAIPFESVPFYGIGTVVAATGYELKSACDTMHDLYELQVLIDPDTAIAAERDEVCGLQVPTKEEVWEMVKSSPSAAWRGARNASSGAIDWIGDVLNMQDNSPKE